MVEPISSQPASSKNQTRRSSFTKTDRRGIEAVHGKQNLGPKSIAFVAADTRDITSREIDQVEPGAAPGERRAEASPTAREVVAEEIK